MQRGQKWHPYHDLPLCRKPLQTLEIPFQEFLRPKGAWLCNPGKSYGEMIFVSPNIWDQGKETRDKSMVAWLNQSDWGSALKSSMSWCYRHIDWCKMDIVVCWQICPLFLISVCRFTTTVIQSKKCWNSKQIPNRAVQSCSQPTSFAWQEVEEALWYCSLKWAFQKL